jgi:ketosteroid isomerase-like protein
MLTDRGTNSIEPVSNRLLGRISIKVWVMKSILMAALLAALLPLCATGQEKNTASRDAVAQEILKAEREQRDAYLRRDLATTNRLVADEYVLTIQGGDIGNKANLLTFMREEPVDPTLSLTTEDTRVSINGDTAIVTGRRIERRRRPDNNQEGVAYARYTRAYVKREGRWLLLAEHIQAIPGERTTVKVDNRVYDDYVGRYSSEIFGFSVIKEGERLIVVPDEARRPKAEVLPEAESEFFVKGRNFRIIFMRGRKGEVAYALLLINGVDIRAKKIG